MRKESTEWPITRKQLRAGRILAGLGMRELSELSRTSTTTIARIENGKIEQPRVYTLERLRDALQTQGVEFTPGGWVRHGDDHEHQEGDHAHPGNRAHQGDHERARGEPGTVIERGLALARRLVRVLEGGK